MYYIIQVDVDGEKKFVYSSKLLVVNKGLAKKFYSLTYVRRYLKHTQILTLRNVNL